MKASADPARSARSARVAAWLNMLDHAEAQLRSLGALPKDRVALREARGQVAALKARKARAVLRGRKSRDVIDGLRRAVTMLHDEGAVHVERSKRLEQVTKHSEERRLELLALAQLLGCDCVPHRMLEAVKALQVAASAEGNECIRVRLPRNGETQIGIDGETWYEQKTGRKV